ncbi:MarR family transcriptional regulator [Geodermatophilus sp. URMC 62]|uniref:MarR family transcriptional regulator n=1 Tax=Geodermatophilus sp. URMC 62 TaxID=3423414 RepID=UPI00406CE960
MQRGEPPLAALLLMASRQLDAVVREELVAHGWPRLSGAQSLVFAFLDADGTPPAELARRLGSTRQAAQDLVAGLVRLGLLEVAADPARRRGRLVRRTATGRELTADAGTVLAGLETAMGERGAALRRLLAAPLDLPSPRPAAGAATG